MDAFLVSTGLVALAECGDKTQLLALSLAVRLRRPWPIVAGILIATLLNHAGAGYAGVLAGQWLQGPWMRWVLGLSFLAFAAWALVPDKPDEDAARRQASTAWSVLVATAIAFFIVEMGDKTQIATVALAARFNQLVAVVLGTTAGMMLANVPVVWLGDRLAHRLPLVALRIGAALVFAALGITTLLGLDV
ncbi:MAG: TMEM165/GDT1 family protein [Alphaproteobacteria bacterium]|nr:TMEM165/GDT1 family protein [Alphaproteobacteria bacterium]